MPLTLRSTGLSSPAYADKLDYVVCEDGKVIGRLYEDATRSPIFVGSGPSRCTSTPSSGRAGKAPTEWVSVFQREGGMRIYLAGPLFTSAERDFNAALAAGLRALGHEGTDKNGDVLWVGNCATFCRRRIHRRGRSSPSSMPQWFAGSNVTISALLARQQPSYAQPKTLTIC